MRKIGYILAFLLFSLKVSAQSFTDAAVAGTLHIDSMCVLTVGTPSTTTFTTVDNYTNSITKTSAATVTIKINYNWTLGVKANTTVFRNVTTGNPSTIPCSIVSLKKSTSGSYTTLSGTNQAIATGNKGPVATSGNSFTLDFNFNPGFLYDGGTYDLTLTYTISRQ